MNPLSVVARTVCNLFAWFLAVFGIYVIVHGHLTPGGGFQGGAVVATFMAFLLVAHGGRKMQSWVRKELFTLMECIGLTVFISAGLLGMSNTFFFNFLAKAGGLFGSTVPLGPNPGALNTSGTIALMNLSVGLEVVGGLSMILLYMFSGVHPEEPFGREETGHDR
ncbi:MAG: sodium:proton antiporter [Synergistaceae bacterium]|jgi:multicomponent Na+:H+ antiporter subunit B|nr:sodium:proton antiporter [Synergistaceae bacterium]